MTKIELPEMEHGHAAVVSCEEDDGRWESVAFEGEDEGCAWTLMRQLGAMGCHARLVRVELAAEFMGDGRRRLRELERREREAYEALRDADGLHADARLGEWLDAWRELRGAREEGEA